MTKLVQGVLSRDSVIGLIPSYQVVFSRKSVKELFPNDYVRGVFSRDTVMGAFPSDYVKGVFSMESLMGVFPSD